MKTQYCGKRHLIKYVKQYVNQTKENESVSAKPYIRMDYLKLSFMYWSITQDQFYETTTIHKKHKITYKQTDIFLLQYK